MVLQLWYTLVSYMKFAKNEEAKATNIFVEFDVDQKSKKQLSIKSTVLFVCLFVSIKKLINDKV